MPELSPIQLKLAYPIGALVQHGKFGPGRILSHGANANNGFRLGVEFFCSGSKLLDAGLVYARGLLDIVEVPLACLRTRGEQEVNDSAQLVLDLAYEVLAQANKKGTAISMQLTPQQKSRLKYYLGVIKRSGQDYLDRKPEVKSELMDIIMAAYAATNWDSLLATVRSCRKYR